MSRKKLTPKAFLPPPQYFYLIGSGAYLLSNAYGDLISVNERSFCRHLRAAGVSPRVPDGGGLSPLEKRLNEIQIKHGVHFAGPLAGHHAGLAFIGGRKILVTDSPRLIQPMPGDWSVLESFIDGMFAHRRGWHTPFAGKSAVLWNPLIQANGPGLGVQGNQFVFNIVGTANIPLVVEASSDLAHSNWVPLLSANLTNGLISLAEPLQGITERVFRVRSP